MERQCIRSSRQQGHTLVAAGSCAGCCRGALIASRRGAGAYRRGAGRRAGRPWRELQKGQRWHNACAGVCDGMACQQAVWVWAHAQPPVALTGEGGEGGGEGGGGDGGDGGGVGCTTGREGRHPGQVEAFTGARDASCMPTLAHSQEAAAARAGAVGQGGGWAGALAGWGWAAGG